MVPLGDGRWLATGHTAGPWSVDAQHGGPPSGLLALGIERCEPRDDMTVARFTCELLGPVPVGEIDLRARVVRPGRSVELVEAVLSAAGRDVARASAWRVRRAEADPVPSRHPSPPLLPPPSTRPRRERPGLGSNYGLATEWRRGRGAAHGLGPKAAWIRMRYPLVPDALTTPLQRVVVTADSGNGVSREFELDSWFFVNPELTVHLHRELVGEWVCLDATTTVTPGGAGLATSVISGELGPVITRWT